MKIDEMENFLAARNISLFWTEDWKRLDETGSLYGFKPGRREVKISTIRGLDQWSQGTDRRGTLIHNGLAYQTVIVMGTESLAEIVAKLNRVEQNVVTALGPSTAPWWRRWFAGAGKRQMFHTGWRIRGSGLYPDGFQMELEATIVGTMTE